MTPPRVLLLANNRAGWRIADYLSRRPEPVVGLVLHPEERRSYGEHILKSVGLEPDRVFDGSRLDDPGVLAAIRALRPTHGVSALFGYLLRAELLGALPHGCVNVHSALLPHNRGAHPNVWSIVDRTPAGVTVHYVDDGVDTGDIVAQRAVSVEPTDTAKTLYRKLERAAVALFKETWPMVVRGTATRTPQDRAVGRTHRRRDLDSLGRIDLDQSCTARELIDRLRARTFPPYPGAYFEEGGRRVYVELRLRGDGPSMSGA